MCLTTDACLTADQGVVNSIPAQFHTFLEIDHEIITTVILLPSIDPFKKGCCQLQAKVCTQSTVKTLYNVTRYNRIFNIRHKIAGNGSVSIKTPSLQQNIHLTTPTVSSGNRYTISVVNKFIITELLPCVRQFCDQNKVFLHEQVSSHLMSGKLCAF